MIWLPRFMRRRELHVRLHKVDHNRKYWIFFFRDPVNMFAQSVVVPRGADWEGVCDAWETMHKRFSESLAERGD